MTGRSDSAVRACPRKDVEDLRRIRQYQVSRETQDHGSNALVHRQDVSFRCWTRFRVLELGRAGSTTNLGDGRVEVVSEGGLGACEQLLEMLREQPPRTPSVGAPRSKYPRLGRVHQVTHQWSSVRGLVGFREG